MTPAAPRSLVNRLYEHLAAYEQHVAPPRRLAEARGTDDWPPAGVYLVYEPGE